jgi:hypothetical protein
MPSTLRLSLALALSLLPGGAFTASRPSHATNWQTPAGTLECGIADVPGSAIDPGTGAPLQGLWPGLQCSAPGIPRGRGAVGDPFVQLGQGSAGRARLVELSEYDLIYDARPVTLPAGTGWSRYGISCRVRARAVSCRNTAGHGFQLSPGELRTY